MTFRIPLSSFVDQTARDAAAAAQQTANTANTAAGDAQTAAASASTAAAAAQQTANTAQAATENITSTQISDAAITTPKLAAGAITAGTIAAGAITAGKLDVNAVQAGNIAAGAVQAGTIAAGAIDGQTITGATLRTAAAGSPRVQVYEITNPDTGAGTGVVEFDDGAGADTAASIMQTAIPNPRSLIYPYGRLRFTGGSYAAQGSEIAAPTWDLSVEQDASGNPRPVARLAGAPMQVDQPIVLGAGKAADGWTGLTLNSTFLAWDSTTNAPQICLNAAGAVELRGIVKLNAAVGAQLSAGTGAPVCTLATKFRPSGIVNRPVIMVNGSGAFVAVVWATVGSNGVLTVNNNTGSLAAGGYGFLLGFSYTQT